MCIRDRYEIPGAGSELGSYGCGPATRSRNSAASSTVRVSGPCAVVSSITQCSLSFGIRPKLGLRPKQPVIEAGSRTEPPPSLAVTSETTPPAIAAEDPPDDPPGVTSRFH